MVNENGKWKMRVSVMSDGWRVMRDEGKGEGKGETKW